MAVQDMEAGNSLAFLDPHGDAALDLLDRVPPWRTNQVIYLDPASERPVGLNPLEIPGARTASSLVSVFKARWADSWGPRSEYILWNAAAALAGRDTLLGLPRILAEDRYRARILRSVTDPFIRSFFHDEFDQWDTRFRTEAIAPIQNKAGQFVTSPELRAILGQEESTFKIPRLMDERGILIANLSKGKLGEDKANLLGSLLISGFEQAALQRTANRTPFFLYVDEFQNLISGTFANLLSESRKFGLGLILANQYLDQLTPPVRSAVFGNVGSLAVFRLGQADAEIIAKQFEYERSATDLTGLGQWEIALRTGNQMYRVKTDKPPPALGRRETVIRLSRERFGRDRANIEAHISQRLGSSSRRSSRRGRTGGGLA